jgi:ribulose-5-phosphate 4-epimerase/fuculose-1-phosphate aldolase
MLHEGYVKYSADYRPAPALEPPRWGELNRARTRLYDLGLVGVYPGGIGYGNVSIRVRGDEFLISGTATGAARVLSLRDYCLVGSVDIPGNRISASGPVMASSEAMTHGALYCSRPEVFCVIHVHSREIFDQMLRGSYPSTPAEAAYGTPEMAWAVSERAKREGPEGTILLAGHDEGLISYGASVEKALSLIEELYRRFAAG